MTLREVYSSHSTRLALCPKVFGYPNHRLSQLTLLLYETFPPRSTYPPVMCLSCSFWIFAARKYKSTKNTTLYEKREAKYPLYFVLKYVVLQFSSSTNVDEHLRSVFELLVLRYRYSYRYRCRYRYRCCC